MVMAISFNACCMASMSAIVWLCASLSCCRSIISNAATYNTRLINNSQNIMNNQSSINILAMFINSTLDSSRDQSKQMIKQIKLNFNTQDEVSKNINQSSQCLWLETFKRSGRDVTDLEELHKERHQPRFRLAWNWPHNLCNSTSWPLYFINKYRETMQYPNGKCLECLNHTKGKYSISLSQCHKPIVKSKYHITEVTIQHLNWNTVHFNTSTYFTNKFQSTIIK